MEAKSEKSSNGFHDIQAQTALPILALLKLQEDLFAQATDGHRADRPLIWFFANRGDAWRVYGCCVSDDEPAGYDIFQLWDGSIMSEDKSLQLLLIVDYIFDWARDVYRPSILRQLKSIVTGSPFDQISLTDDSDIASMRRNISNWIQAPPSTAAAFDFEQDLREPNIAPPLDHQGLLPLPIPNTRLGTLHSAAFVDSRIEGLYITEQNVKSFLELAGGPNRELLNFLSKWDELILLTGDDLNDLEEAWTGRSRAAEEASTSSNYSKFYVLIETKIFMNTSWTTVREITYLAVSEAAFKIIVDGAKFKIQHPGIKSVPKVSRPCSKKILIDALNCLISGSPAQLFIAATACTCRSLYSLPERKRSDYNPTTEALGLGDIRQSRLSGFIKKFQRIRISTDWPALRIPSFKIPTEVLGFTPKQQRIWFKKQFPHAKSEDLSFIRVSERVRHASEIDFHDENLCARCIHSRKYEEKQHHLTASSHDGFSAYGLNLVVSLNTMGNGEDRNDICLFAIDTIPELTDNMGLAVIVEDLLQSGYVHHTIRHPIEFPVDTDDTIWNIPLPYRPVTEKEKMDITDWVKELKGYSISVPTEQKTREDRWDSLQLLLHFLVKGKTWARAEQDVKLKKKSGKRVRDEVYGNSREEVRRKRAERGEIIIERQPIIRWGPFPETTRGDTPMP